MGDTGLEPTPKTSEETAISDQGGAESGALEAQMTEFPLDLAAVVDAWPTLPEAIRAGILAMIRAADEGS